MTNSSSIADGGRLLRNFLLCSLAAHLIVVGILIATPARGLFISSIGLESKVPQLPVEQASSSVPDSGEGMEVLLQKLEGAITDYSGVEELRSIAGELFLEIEKKENRFLEEQRKALADRLGVSPSELKEMLPVPTETDVDSLLQKLAEIDDPAELRMELDRLYANIVERSRSAGQQESMAEQFKSGETPLEGWNIALERDPALQKQIEEGMQQAALERNTKPRDLTGMMRSYFGDETAPGRKVVAASATLTDAVPGRVQVTGSGLLAPPLEGWLLDKIYLGETLPSLPATKLLASGGEGSSGPVYIDSWFVVGPWALDSEEDFFKEFPPEKEVNLDAVYTGKGGRTLSWNFVQSKEPLVELPLQIPDSVTYAYTEIHCAEEMEVWMLCGGDDRLKLWVNGLPIFASPARLKGWHIGNEGARKVYFKQGRNEVLARIDNLPGFTRFSVVLLPGGSEDTIFQKRGSQ